MESDRNFVKRLFSFSIGPIMGSIISFIMVPLQTWLIDPSQLGMASMFNITLNLTAMILYLGLDQAYGREYYTERNKSNLLWNCFIVPVSFSVILLFLYMIFNNKISNLLFGSSEKIIIIILGLSLPLEVIYRFNISIIRMSDRARIYSIVQIFNKILNIIFLLPILLLLSRDFRGIIYAQYLSLLTSTIFTFVINKNVWIYKFKLEYRIIKKIFFYGLPLVPTSLLMWILSSMDRIALRAWSDFNELGLYAAAFKIVSILGIIQTSFSVFWSPTKYKWYESDAPIYYYEKVSNKISTLMILVCVVIIVFKDTIFLLLSPSYRGASEILPFLLFYPVFYTISETTQVGIAFSRKTYLHIIITVIAGGLNIIGNNLLVPKYGALGASISTGICYLVFFWLRTIISNIVWKKVKIKNHIISMIIMISISVINLLYNIILINLIILAIIYLYYKNDIKWGLKLLKVIIKEYFQKKRNKE